MLTDPQPKTELPSVPSRGRIKLTADEREILAKFIRRHGSVREAAAHRAPGIEGPGVGVSYGTLQAFQQPDGTITCKQAVKLAGALGVRLDSAKSAGDLKHDLLRALGGEFEHPGRRGKFLGTWTGHCLQHKPGMSEPVEIRIELVLKPGSNTPGNEIKGSGTFSPVGGSDPTTVEIELFGGFVDIRDDTYVSLRYRPIDPSEMLAFGTILLHLESKSSDITGALAGWGPVSAGWVYGAVKLSKSAPPASPV